MLPDYVSVKILDVLLYREKKGRVHTRKRTISALSFRLNSNTKFLFHGKELSASTDSIAFVPQGIAYDRITQGE